MASSAPVPDLAVVVISHGHERLLNGCLQSVLAAAEGLRVETVLVDNLPRGALDLPAACEARIMRNARPQGFAANANAGIAATTAAHLLLVNPDVRIRSGALREAVAHLSSDPSIGCVGAMLLNPDGTRQPSARAFPGPLLLAMRALGADGWGRRVALYRNSMMIGEPFDRRTEVDWVTGAFMLMPRGAFERAGGFDPRYRLYYEDVDLCFRMSRLSLRTVLDPAIVAVHDHARDSAKGVLRSTFRWHLTSAARFMVRSSLTRIADALARPAALPALRAARARMRMVPQPRAGERHEG